MNYEDELDRSRARKSRRRESESETSAKRRTHRTEDLYSMSADPGSRAGRAAAKSHGAASHNHRRRKNGNKKKKIIIGVLIALIVLVLGFSGAVYAYIQHNFGKMNGQNNFDIADVRNENISLEMRDKMEKGYWTIAVFGLDSRDNSTGKGNQSDVIMIVNLNRETGEIKLVSVYRDTYLNINDKNVYNKINAAYATKKGIEQTKVEIERLMGFQPDKYVIVNFEGIAAIVDAIGGVDYDVPFRMEYHDPSQHLDIDLQPGMQHLTGKQTVEFLRWRHNNDYSKQYVNGDEGRVENLYLTGPTNIVCKGELTDEELVL